MRVNRNIKIIILVFACAYGMLCFRYVSLQILQRDEFRKKKYVRKEQQDRIEQYVLQGDITLRKGKPHVDSRRILARDRATVASLADNGFFRRSGEGISLDANALVVSNPRLNHSRDTVLRGSIRDRENRLLAWSTINGQRQKRHYSSSIPDFHTVGYVHPVFGKSGLEKSTDSFLRGSADGWRGALAWVRNPNQGNDVIAALDSRLQRFAAEQMNGRRGAVLVIDPRTGEIIVCLSNPAFDPNSPKRVWNAAAHDTDSAMRNRCWEKRYPPGSTFKILVAAAALESETVSRDQRFECNGYFHPIPGARYAIHDFEWSRKKGWRGHNPKNAGWWTIEDAFIRSCNSTFAQVGVSLGNEKLFAMAEEFGFFSPVPIRLGPDRLALQSEPGSLFHDISDPALLPRDKFSKGSLAQTAIGQYETRTTVLQMALVASAVANKGIVMMPTLVKSVMDPNGKILYSNPPEKMAAPISEATARALQDFMRKAAVFGTGKRAHAECATIAGKTGTAQVPGKKPHAWFVGFAPHDEPEVVIVVLVENSGTGGSIAAPIAGRILNRYFEEESVIKEAT